jgi:hypothetical protein
MLIHEFLKMQRQAKDLIHQKLGIPPNTRASVWEANHSKIRATYEAAPFAKTFFIHGLGVRIITDDINIDFDYSMEGYEDGFDDWRIFMFMIGCDPSKWDPKGKLFQAINQWVKDLELNAHIQMRDNLFYLQDQGSDVAS